MHKYSLINVYNRSNELAVDLKLIKDYLKISHDLEDSLLTSIVKTVTRICESRTSRALTKESVELRIFNNSNEQVTLPIVPANQIYNVETTDHFHNLKEFGKEHYSFDATQGILTFKIIPFAKEIRIKYGAGYETPDALPDELRFILLAHIAHIFEDPSMNTDFPKHLYDGFRNYKL